MGGIIIHNQDTPSGLPKMIRKLGSYSSFNRVRDFRRALKPPVDWGFGVKILNHQKNIERTPHSFYYYGCSGKRDIPLQGTYFRGDLGEGKTFWKRFHNTTWESTSFFCLNIFFNTCLDLWGWRFHQLQSPNTGPMQNTMTVLGKMWAPMGNTYRWDCTVMLQSTHQLARKSLHIFSMLSCGRLRHQECPGGCYLHWRTMLV